MNRIPLFKRLTGAFLALEGLLYAWFLLLDLSGRGAETLWIKYGALLLCGAMALFLAWNGGDRLVFPALLFTAGADWFLLVRGDHLALGVALFLAVQTLYLVRLRRFGAASGWWLRSALALLLGGAVLALDLAGPLTLLAALCFSQLLSNTILAWQAGSGLFALGLTLFVCCDVCVGLYNLGVLLPFSYVGMWLFYLPSQVLITLSAKEVPYETK